MSDNFDISQFEASDTAILEVMNAKDEALLFNGQPVKIELYGPGSDHYLKAQAKIDRATQTRTFAALRGKTLKDSEGNDARKEQAEKLAACTANIINFPIPGGAVALYSNPKLGYIRDQVAKFIEDWANFPNGSTKT